MKREKIGSLERIHVSTAECQMETGKCFSRYNKFLKSSRLLNIGIAGCGGNRAKPKRDVSEKIVVTRVT